MMKKVLLIGDSIRMSYQNAVQEILKDEAEVWGPEENCLFSLYTAARQSAYLQEFGKPDIVHWNNGLHDLGCNLQRGPLQFALSDYIANLNYILKHMQAVGVKVIWASTTPVDEEIPPNIPNWSWSNSDVIKYNLAAASLMNTNNIAINDLYSLIANRSEYYCDDHIHLSEAGKKICAEQVVKILRANW